MAASSSRTDLPAARLVKQEEKPLVINARPVGPTAPSTEVKTVRFHASRTRRTPLTSIHLRRSPTSQPRTQHRVQCDDHPIRPTSALYSRDTALRTRSSEATRQKGGTQARPVLRTRIARCAHSTPSSVNHGVCFIAANVRRRGRASARFDVSRVCHCDSERIREG